jgi:hypothetical protein
MNFYKSSIELSIPAINRTVYLSLPSSLLRPVAVCALSPLPSPGGICRERLWVLSRYQSPGAPHPRFPVEFVGSLNLMRLSLKKGAHAVLSRAAYRKFGASCSFFARCGIPRTLPSSLPRVPKNPPGTPDLHRSSSGPGCLPNSGEQQGSLVAVNSINSTLVRSGSNRLSCTLPSRPI